jgi:tRNA(Ile)-lysidine synthase
MRPKYGRVIRPLLEVTRQEVLTYLETNGCEFCHDSSNESVRFLRNRIRMELLPLLEERFNPSIRNTILNTARILEIEEEFLSAESDRLYSSLAILNTHNQPSISFAQDALSAIPAALRRRLFERACWEIGCRPDFRKIGKIEALLDSAGSGPELHLQSGVRVVRQLDSLLFTTLAANQHPREQLAQATEFRHDIPGPGTYLVAELDRRLEIEIIDDNVLDHQTMRVDADSVDFPLRLRSVLPGDRFTPLGAPGRKKVARFLSDRKVPKHIRAQHPVLESAQGIICVLGLEIDERCRSAETTSRWLVIRWERG